jgi:hypothetical protein
MMVDLNISQRGQRISLGDACADYATEDIIIGTKVIGHPLKLWRANDKATISVEVAELTKYAPV